jgi:hypothetical protein
MTKGIAEHTSECTKLQHLDSENYDDDLSYDDIQSLIKLTGLRSFAFCFCSEDVSNNLPMFFLSGSFSQLMHLNLSESYYISDILMNSVFENCPQLRHLNISGGQSLQNDGLRYIGRCNQLKLWIYQFVWISRMVVRSMLVQAVTIWRNLTYHLVIK